MSRKDERRGKVTQDGEKSTSLGLGQDSGFPSRLSPHSLCDLGQVTQPLRASVSSSMKSRSCPSRCLGG